MLQLGHHLATQGKRTDLIHLEVNGGSTNSITQATAHLQLWAQAEPNP